jgi:hypothetical protein
MKKSIEERVTCMQINTDDFHPEQKYQCNFDVTPTKTVITYGNTVEEAMNKMNRELKRYL